ncbi:MAG: hypothetical protein IPI60_16155 [Saprospiraceae bacterium]|nr:hypothetical protein [Saprospiraceae bacterium]
MKKLFLAICFLSTIACVQNTENEPLITSITSSPNKAANNWVPKALWSSPKKAFLYNVNYNNASYLLTYSYASNLFIRIKNINNSKTVTFSKVSNGTKVQSGSKSKIYLTGQNIPLLEWLTLDMLKIFHVHLLGAKTIGGKDLIQYFAPNQWDNLAQQVILLDEFSDVVEEDSDCMHSVECDCGNGITYAKSCPCEQQMDCGEVWGERCEETTEGEEVCETHDYCIVSCV